jgi:flagellar hook-associated protein 2
MSGGFSVGGLITGLDSNSIIRQLIQLERQPILRLQDRISILTQRQTAVRDLRTTLTTLRNSAQDFRFNNIFGQFAATSSEESVLNAAISGQSPVSGSYSVNVIQLASATVATSSATLGSAIDPNATLANSGITTDIEAGTFSINGVQFTVDPTTDSLDSILSAINSSGAGVNATYNATTDRVTITNTAANDTSVINFGATDDNSNLLEVIRVNQATQTTGTGGSTEVSSTRNLGAINPSEELNTVSFAGGAITSGSFRINGISINVDASVDSLSEVLGRINDSDAGVIASYDASTDTIRVVSKTLGSRTVNFASDSSNFLNVTNLATATQTAGNDSQFTINGGATLTRNTNAVADAIGGVTLNLQSVGASTVTVSVDDDAILEDVQEFVDEFNASVAAIRELVGQGGLLENDSSIRFIENFLRTNIFSSIPGISGTFKTLTEIGITTGNSFESGSISELQIDEDAFREALRTNRGNVEDLFSNSGKTGIGDIFFSYLDEATSSKGFLNERVRSNGIFDQQIQSLNDQIDRLEGRVALREQRLRLQFSKLEQLSATYQSQGAALSAIGGGFSIF